jgi:uncharacterized protein YecT (DUF1311 family)
MKHGNIRACDRFSASSVTSPTEPGNRMHAFAALLLSLLIACSSSAAAAEPTPSRRLCDPDKIKQTNAWVDCLQNALDKSEAGLTALVGKIAVAMQANDMLEEPKRDENRKLFEATQMKWLQLRDDDCKSFAANHAGLGFGAAQFRLVCLLDETVSREQTLKRRYRDDLK